MTVINTKIIVASDGAVSIAASLPEGEHAARIEVVDQPVQRRPALPTLDDLPTLDLGPWPVGLSLRREDIYGDDGR